AKYPIIGMIVRPILSPCVPGKEKQITQFVLSAFLQKVVMKKSGWLGGKVTDNQPVQQTLMLSIGYHFSNKP
ncbi:hypothetical protein, partial [Endozoicomonas sp. ONNA2]|uniref:hypothetical protein n=1 Tax=Endozoicomonas sp. ONNA2 TaxID=2828741 RepID=UPI0021498629